MGDAPAAKLSSEVAWFVFGLEGLETRPKSPRLVPVDAMVLTGAWR
jgi:hypothetical protein